MDTVKTPAKQSVILHNVSWGTYERLLDERGESRAPRFVYDRGELEIMSPSAKHEEIVDLIAALVRELAVEWEIDMRAVGHTTFRRSDLGRGFEPDGSFYFSENARRVRGKADLDLEAGDPPPDLVIEVDRTSPSLDKLPIYARLGIPEVWRYVVGERPEILLARKSLSEVGEEGYQPAMESHVLPRLTGEVLARLVWSGQIKAPAAWAREVREWARERSDV